jgi:DNA-3-methyladenine glycosylase
MYWCLNVVTGPPGDGQAVLLRGGVAVAGLDEMRRNRPKCRVDAKLADGPGKLAIALGISGSQNGVDLCSGYGFCLRHDGFIPDSIEVGPRVGISKNVDKPWRFRLLAVRVRPEVAPPAHGE